MSAQTLSRASDPPSYSANRLFLASCIAILATAMTFAIRGDIMDALGHDFTLSKEQIGSVAGTAFWGFTISIFIGSQLCDALGMGKILALAFLCHVAGIVTTLLANGYGLLFTGTLLIGLGNGLIEAAANPLVATIYATDKTHKLNRLHAWFPGGNVIGGLIAYGLGIFAANQHLSGHLPWQIKMIAIFVPVAVYGALFLGQTYPATERVQSNISTREMYAEALRPMFLLWVFCMLLTASTELGTGQWITSVLSKVAGAGSILVLVWVNAVMWIGRSVAGPVVHRLSPIGTLTVSAVLSLIDLFALSYANTEVTAFAAATIFGMGTCYFWPTMLGVTSERFPRGGSLLMGIMGAAGMLSVATILPVMGSIMDHHKNDPAIAFRYMSVFPAILVVIFTALYLRDRARGGYRPEILTPKDSPVEVTV